uniref:Uncharacterized protein n=1 Tax=Ditylenchus dipsaci TaxID=166011 RepID=A0A915CSM3_9BILA
MGSSHMMLPSNVVCLSFVYWITCFVGCHNLPRSVFEKIWVFRRCTHRGAGRSAYTVRQYYRILQILCGWKMQAGIFYDNGDTQQMAAVGCVFESSGNQLFQANYAMQLTRWGFEQMVLPKVEKAIHSQQKSMSGCFANLALIRKRDQMKTFSKQMAAVGCVFESSGNQLFQANYAMQLTRWGFEQMVLPKVEKAIHSQQKSMSGCFANLALIRKGTR